MAFQITGIVQNPDHVDHFVAAAVDEEMSRFSHNVKAAFGPIAAEEEMICPNSLRQFRPFLRPWPLRIGGNVPKRLLQKVPSSRTTSLALPYRPDATSALMRRSKWSVRLIFRVGIESSKPFYK